jgi:ribose transport system substrate-binding protein
MKFCTRYFFALIFSALFAAGCGENKDAPAIKGRIGMTCMDLTNPFFKLIANVMTEEAAKHGYEVTALSGELDPAKQNSQMSDFVAQGYDAIFLNPVDSHSAGQGVKAAHEAGIPVFSFDVQVSDEEASKLVSSHIGSDNFQGGQLAGESMMKALGNKGKVAVVSLPEVTSCILRVDGFKDALKKANSPIEIVTELTGKGARDAGYAVTTDILQAHPDITGIFAINDPSALGAHAAVVKAGKQNQITIVAFDASPAGKQAVFEKKLYDTPQQFPRKMAVGTVAAFIEYLGGTAPDKRILIPCENYRYEDSINDESREKEQW